MDVVVRTVATAAAILARAVSATAPVIIVWDCDRYFAAGYSAIERHENPNSVLNSRLRDLQKRRADEAGVRLA